MGALECALQAGLVVDVACDHLGTELRERLRLVGIRIAGDCTRGETAGRIFEDGADESAALGAGGTGDCYDSL